ncbi:MAG: Calx-beta domain-containing protein, partial [Nocardioidaceae bacterium]
MPTPTGIIQDGVEIGATVSGGNALLTIIEDELHFVNLSAETYAVDEGIGAATITLVRSGTPALMQGSFTVDVEARVAFGPMAATAGVDFNTVTTSVVFGPGVTTRTFTVPILEDTVVDGPREVDILITGVTPINTAGGPGRTHPQFAVLTINDNDSAGTIQLSAVTYSVDENVASGLATVTLTRTGGLASQVAVDIQTGDLFAPVAPMVAQTASAGSDYTSTSGAVIFAAGETVKTVTIPIVDDGGAQNEGIETVNLRILNQRLLNAPPRGSDPTLGAQTTAVLRIVDNEATVSFALANFDVNESAGVATITVERTVTALGASVNFSTSDGSATVAAGDYAANSGTLNFGPGQAVATFTVQINDNTSVAADKLFDVNLSGPSGAVIATGRGTATVTIKDNDVGGTVGLASTAFTALESGGLATITVVRALGNAGGVTVDWATSDPGGAGSATAGSDYTASSGTVTFGAGEFVKTFTVPILNDTGTPETPAPPEGDEVFDVLLSNATNAQIVNSPATVTIYDDDGPIMN